MWRRKRVNAQNEGVYMDGVGAGPPLSSPNVLSALGVAPDDVTTAPNIDAEKLFTAGFPSRECRLSAVTTTPVENAPYQESADAHVNLPTEPARAAGGFGMNDFLSTIRGLEDAPEVQDPFGSEDVSRDPGADPTP